jgi:hypothetical protein
MLYEEGFMSSETSDKLIYSMQILVKFNKVNSQHPSISSGYILQPKHLLQWAISKIINNSDSEENTEISDTEKFSEHLPFQWQQ